MASYLKSSGLFLFLLTNVFLIACNSKSDEKATEKKDTMTDTTASTTQASQPKANPATGVTLDMLYVDATSFKNLPPQKIFFVVTYINPDIVTLHGWPQTGSSYDKDPAIMLQKGAASITLNQDTTYVGNVKLDNLEVRRVKDSITSTHANYVLFIPTPSTTYKNHVEYIINVTQDNPALVKTPLSTSTGVTANPSPPKTN